ncbi:unnamed protein product [Knipowitschia caucasica]
MPRGSGRKSTRKAHTQGEETVVSPSESEDSNASANTLASAEGLANDKDMDAISASIIAEIQKVRSDVNEATGQLRQDLFNFRGETNSRLAAVETNVKQISDRIGEAERRVSNMEDISADVNDALAHTLELHDQLQKRLVDLEARSRRNNIRIHGIREEAEGNDLFGFIENFIKTELALSNTSLGIQRCHRSLAAKPPTEANPRSIVLCFLEFRTKELVLKAAWNKKDIQFQGRRIFFEQDYTSDALAKRKAYAPVRRALKEKGLRFQTLHPARLRVHLHTGPVVYSNASEAAEDLKKKGAIDVEITTNVATPGKSTETRMATPPWHKAGVSRHQREMRITKIKERLNQFRRDDCSA